MKAPSKFCVVTSEAWATTMTVVWAPVGSVMPGVYDITFIQESGFGLHRKRAEVAVTLCRKTLQRLVDEIFRDEDPDSKTKSYGTRSVR